MLTVLVLVIFLALGIYAESLAASVVCTGNISTESYQALEDLYNSASGTNWIWDPPAPSPTVWRFPSPLSAPCSDRWQGLICGWNLNHITCVINTIYLQSRNLKGTIPPELGNLVDLEQLHLGDNSLVGAIPSELGNLTNMEFLYLNYNFLVSTIPSQLGKLVSMEVLDLDSNLLEGGIPSEFGNLVNMTQLILFSNSLTGTIPSELGNITGMRILYLNNNSLVGAIPSELGNVVQMENLYLHSNSLEGPIPSELGNLVNMEVLYLYDNFLGGPIPTEIGNMVLLGAVDLDSNLLNGTIPSELGNLTLLEVISLYSNSLDGPIPSELGNLVRMEALYLYANSLEGTIPSELGNLTSIEFLYLNYNSLVGTIPSELGNPVSMKVLALDSNLLEGTIPSQLGKLVNIEVLDLDSNLLNGTIPSELGNHVNMTQLLLFSNSLTGTIPSELGNITGMRILYLNNNSLVGAIPSELGNVVQMENLYLHSNSLEGPIPSELGNLVNMEVLYLYDNFLGGPIPTEIGNMVLLGAVDLDSNLLNGTIPSELGNLTLLEVISLYSNSLDGPIPSELGNLVRMEALYLYENFLDGTVPSELGNLVRIKNLVLYSNSLEGTIPSELGNLSNLVYLALNNNLLSGTIPTELGNLVNMEELYLNGNSFAGSLSFLANIARVRQLDVGRNLLSGTLPLAMESLPLLQYLNLSSNMLSGSIAVSVQKNLSSRSFVSSLDLSKNHFCGTIPESLFVLPLLQTVILSQNCFSGTLPSSMCLNHNLENVVLDLLTGNCGSTTGYFQGFVLRKYMRGTIPACIWNSSSIRILHLLGNGLMGSLEDFPDSSQLSVLALGSNQLTGTIPIAFQRHSFGQLDLSMNRLSGTLETDLLVNQTTTVYDLSVNRLSGDIPSSLYASFAAGVINVLEGNLFDCQQYDVPASDVNQASYQCGSVDFEYSFLAWIAGFGTFSVLVTLAKYVGVHSKNQFVSISRSPEFLGIIGGPLGCLAVTVFGLILYVLAKLPNAFKVATSTHVVQYWWTSTATFVHNWQISIFLMLLLAVACVLCAVTIVSLVRENGSSFTENRTTCVGSRATMFSLVGVHLVNIIAVTVVNGVYILIAVDNVRGFVLLTVQAAVATFKFGWSTTAIPWLLSKTISNSSLPLVHWIFMVLFVFLGAPFVSSFCESSSCFLYVLTSPRPISFTFVVPSLSISIVRGTFGYQLFYISVSLIYQNSILPPWIYSYQCSSAVITSYAPVLLLSYLVSGIIIPFVLLLFSNCSELVPVVIKNAMRLNVSGMIFFDNPSTATLLENNAISILGRKMVVKYILNAAVMLTFGLAVPLLSVAVICDTILNLATVILFLERFAQLSEHHRLPDTEKFRQEFWNSFRLDSREVPGCVYIVMGYVSVFWSLFVFDWIADVYGSFAGGLAMVVPLLMPTLVGYCVLRRQGLRGQILVTRQHSNNIELAESDNPMIMPQTTNDDFSAGDN
jgi:Leucine-rich repeat (LRR) protein